jgi:hypothetical protein
LDAAPDQIVTPCVADYNTKRPLSSFGYRAPAAYADHLFATGHRAALHDGSARCPVADTAAKAWQLPRLSSPLEESSVAGQPHANETVAIDELIAHPAEGLKS